MSGSRGLVRGEQLLGLGRKENSAVTVCFKVYANVVMLRRVMQVLDSGWHTANWKTLIDMVE